MAAAEDAPGKSGKNPKPKPPAAAAKERLAEALRENLRRRKAQERARDTADPAKHKPR